MGPSFSDDADHTERSPWRGVNPYIAVKYRKAFGVVSPQGYTPFAMALALAS